MIFYSRFLLVFFTLMFCKHVISVPISTKAKYAVVMDYDTGNILFDKSAEQRIFPASMSKLMTIYILFEALEEGTISLDSEFYVSKKAWRKGGSKMFVEPDSNVKVRDLLKGIIVQSGNDACIVVAEGISGDEDTFADLMNAKAKEIGLVNSNFTNSTGWPDDNHYMTPFDLAILAKSLMNNFPNFYSLFKEKEFTYNNIKQSNRNPLLYSYQYADGLKTGYTDISGYSLASTANKGNIRLIAVLSGMDNVKERKDETIKVLEWAFREYTNINLFSKGDTIIEADVWLGKKAIIDLVAKEDILFTLKKKNTKIYNAKVVFDSPIKAPIVKGKTYGKIIISDTVVGNIEYPVIAKESIKKAGIFKKISSAFSYLIFGGYAD